jgi:predicted dehydrogenase
MARLRAGVIGVGAFGEIHLEAYRSLFDVEVVAISDTRPSRLREISRKYQIQHCCTDFEELCARKDIDLVSIATPEGNHLAPVRAAAREGKHVLLEKPIATSLHDAEQIITAAEKARIIFMVGHILRFENTYGTVKREIEQGNLGKIVSIHARRNRPRQALHRMLSRVHPIISNGIHDIDLCLWYTRDHVTNVRAITRKVMKGNYPEVNWSLLEFRGGAVACLETHWMIPDKAGVMANDAMQVIGTKGVADIHFGPLYLWKKTGAETPNVSYDAWFNNRVYGAIREEVNYFVDCVRNRCSPAVIEPADGVNALKVALALVRSSKEKRDVKMA